MASWFDSWSLPTHLSNLCSSTSGEHVVREIVDSRVIGRSRRDRTDGRGRGRCGDSVASRREDPNRAVRVIRLVNLWKEPEVLQGPPNHPLNACELTEIGLTEGATVAMGVPGANRDQWHSRSGTDRSNLGQQPASKLAGNSASGHGLVKVVPTRRIEEQLALALFAQENIPVSASGISSSGEFRRSLVVGTATVAAMLLALKCRRAGVDDATGGHRLTSGDICVTGKILTGSARQPVRLVPGTVCPESVRRYKPPYLNVGRLLQSQPSNFLGMNIHSQDSQESAVVEGEHQ